MTTIRFLHLTEVLEIHHDQISRYGGLHGVLNIGLLESAVAQPKAQFHGDYLHADIPRMAAAYAYHLCLNHPFYDGNKRTALVSMLLFLKINHIDINFTPLEAEKFILQIAQKQITKAELVLILQKHIV